LTQESTLATLNEEQALDNLEAQGFKRCDDDDSIQTFPWLGIISDNHNREGGWAESAGYYRNFAHVHIFQQRRRNRELLCS